MNKKYQGKYRIESNRFPGWDYSQDGIYFLTLITYDRDCHFGDVKENMMIHSAFGDIVKDEWLKSFQMREKLLLDEYIIMPNHLHAIIFLKKPQHKKPTTEDCDSCKDARPCVSIHETRQTSVNAFKRSSKSISSFVSGFKSATINAIDNYIDENALPMQKFNRQKPLWHANYHDHIIRDKESYCAIKNYIRTNPASWSSDKFHKP